MKISEWSTVRYAPIMVLIGGLLLTVVAFTFFQAEADREAREGLELRTERFAATLRMCMQEALSVSRDIRALVENDPSVDAARLRSFARLGGGEDSAIGEIRWIAFLTPSAGTLSAPSFASMDVVAAGAGVPAFAGGRIAAEPAFMKAAIHAWQTGKPTLYAPEGEQGIGAPVYLSVINREPASALGRRPLLLAVALNVESIVGDSLTGFLARENRTPIESYAIRIKVVPNDEVRPRGRLLFAAPAVSHHNEQDPGSRDFGVNGSAWLENERMVDHDGTRFHFSVAVARSEIDAPEGEIAGWAAGIGLFSTLLLALAMMRATRAKDLAEDASRKLDSQVRSGEARFRNLVDSTRDWMWETDANGAISFTSGRVHALLGYTPREILGRRGPEFGFGLDLESAAATVGRVEIAAKHSSGREIWLQCACSRFVDEQGRLAGYRGVCSDITEVRNNANRQRGLELELNRMDKVGTLEHVMSMVAHELNQPLAAISSYCGASVRMLRDHPAPVEEIISSLKAAGTQAQAAAAVVRGIRQFIVHKEPNFASLRVEDLIGNATTLAAFRLNQGKVQLELRPESNLPAVLADEVLIVQVLLNLLHNAVDALVDVANPRIRIETVQREEGWVCITVEDNGCGMSDEQLARCFEPYFTSKASGLGLGLSISGEIVESHGGTLKILRNPQGGCSVELRLKAQPPKLRDASTGASHHDV